MFKPYLASAAARLSGEMVKTRVIGMSVEVRLRRVGEGGVAVDHQGQGGFVELANIVEQQIARFRRCSRCAV